MRLDDYSILKNFKRDTNIDEFLREHGGSRAFPLLIHHLSEEHGYAQHDAFNMAKIIMDELSTTIRFVNSVE